MSTPSLSASVLDGDRHALARLLTRLENNDDIGQQALERLFPHTGKAHLIGITGPPGGGKSTLVNELIRTYRQRGSRVAVIAIDPSSPLTGGATLGDRIRMQEWHDDPGVFIRSMASRRFGGGLAQNTLALAQAFDAAGYDPVIIETVGTGQDEVAVASLAMTTLLIQVPGTGDGIQALKAGSLEIGDVLVVTKGDRPEAAELARDLRNLRQISIAAGVEHSGWESPVVRTSAIRSEGIDTLIDAIDQHRSWLVDTGAWDERMRTTISTEVSARVQAALFRRMEQSARVSGDVADILDTVAKRQLTPQRAAERILSRLT
ncbi:MAG TPA: methylmalonyl Co-A mutase-associated GTPase MeaB [Thermomicrobiales bacterium]|nr:methylmalonyl Co-A mutase-associated GTPase MeaB [Thermomicrobiales bacterium]